ncbi:hypothetical protein M0804_000534 [Polistes exclamans]|nr:hypothetical protein M0804_000534 [Polistes exclamans]
MIPAGSSIAYLLSDEYMAAGILTYRNCQVRIAEDKDRIGTGTGPSGLGSEWWLPTTNGPFFSSRTLMPSEILINGSHP